MIPRQCTSQIALARCLASIARWKDSRARSTISDDQHKVCAAAATSAPSFVISAYGCDPRTGRPPARNSCCTRRTLWGAASNITFQAEGVDDAGRNIGAPRLNVLRALALDHDYVRASPKKLPCQS